jgi:PAS domain S-box-containing protein
MKTVLLAYERDQDLAALETLLQARGHRVLKARSGVEALEAARQDPPHVLVCDVLLPKLDGFALCRRVKEDPLLQHLPVVLASFRIEGPKYEAFAAEVGAERFFPRGSRLEEVAVTVEAQQTGSGTMRMPALVPEMIERREQDRRRVAELERHVRDLEAANQQITIAERVAREKAERETRSRIDLAAADAARIQELVQRLRDVERRSQELLQAESRARGVVEESRAEVARLAVLESRLAEVDAARARAQAAADDAQRVFTAQPLATWLSDLQTNEVRAASDSAAALFGQSPSQLEGCSILEVLPGYVPGADPARPVDVAFKRLDGSAAILELRQQSVSYGGRGCWLATARDVTTERARSAAHQDAAGRAAVLDASPLATCVTDAEGRLQYVNAAFRTLMRYDAAATPSGNLRQFEVPGDDESTVRSVSIAGSGLVMRECPWRRADGSVFDAELSIAEAGLEGGARVVAVRDVTSRRRAQQRAEREHRRSAALLDLAQKSHSLSESEILSESVELLSQLTRSPTGSAFLALPEPTQLELATLRSPDAPGHSLPVLTRWRGTPPADSALFECLERQRIVAREAVEGTGPLQQAGLPGSLRRQLCVPFFDGGRVAGVLLLADKAEPYVEEDHQHAVQVGDALWKVLRRRRSDAEVVSAMDHMERVMLGAVEALGSLAETQDGCKTGRAQRVAELAASIGTALGLPGHTVRGLRVMGQLIDVGMLQIPREILWRPGQFAPAEHELVKTHVERGYESLRRIEFPWPVADAVRQHHERLDGSGYPRGLRGEEILLEARILAVADAADAMLSPRPQRSALSLAACVEELQSQAGRRYDARVVKACVKLLRERETETDSEPAAGQRIA